MFHGSLKIKTNVPWIPKIVESGNDYLIMEPAFLKKYPTLFF